jgi:hypothetical protein
MTRRAGNRLVLAVSDPDLRLPPLTMAASYQPGAAGQLRLRLNGRWQLEQAPPTVQAPDDHTLALTCRDGATYEVVLRAR